MQAADGTPRLRHLASQTSPRLAAAGSPHESRRLALSPAHVAPTPHPPLEPRVAWDSPPGLRPAPAVPDLEQGPRVFEQCFGSDPDRVERARRLMERCGKALLLPQPPGARIPAPQDLPPRLQPIELMALLEAYEAVVPKDCLADAERTLSALEELVTALVQPQELPKLVALGRFRDACRTVACAELTYAASFGAAGATGLSLVENPLIDPGAQAPAAQGLNVSSAFMLTGAVIGVGGEVAQAAIREGRMGPRYNAAVTYADGKRAPFAESPPGQSVQRRSALPFGLLYAADQLVRSWIPSPSAVRLALGAGAAAMAALYRLDAVTRGGGVLDPTWLDGSSADKREAMQAAIADLRLGGWKAVVGYCTDHVGPGLQASAAQVLSVQGAFGSLVRLLSASVSRAGYLVTAATGTDRMLPARVAADVWLGLSYGTTSTWAQRLQGRVAPGSARPAAQEVAPAAAPTRPPR